IFRLMPIAVFSRPPYSKTALMARSARVFADSRVAEPLARKVVTMQPPAWVFMHTPPHAGSATRIRARQKVVARTRKRAKIAVGQ
ncbi:MAG: nicotinic acid mononucleotide adenylyltransferase, partial [Rhodospirillales bacterium]